MPMPSFFIRWTVRLLTVAMAVTALAAEHRTTLTLKADGTSVVTNESIESRVLAEQQARMWERYRQQEQGDVANDVKAPEKPQPEPKPLTDDELAGKLRAAFTSQAELRSDDDMTKLEALEVKSNTVRTVTTQTFPTLEDTVRRSHMVWAMSGLSPENVKFEKDTEGHLRVTFVPSASASRYLKSMRQQWKRAGSQSELRLVFPGKVLASAWPNTQGNATWITIDAEKPETLSAVEKLSEGPSVITAEWTGLRLDQPLESKAFLRSRRSVAGGSELPVTDAGPGFATEAVAVTTTTIYYFPEGAKHMRQAGTYSANRTGVVVRAKFFAPKNRTLQSVSDVRVIKATDDKGRVIPAAGENANDETGSATFYSVVGGGSSRSAHSTQISLQLQLPQADAQSIDELSAEAIALTAGAWKEMTLTNVAGLGTNELDLAEVLPGAKLSVVKFTNKNHQLHLQARLSGPAGIRQLELSAKTSGRQESTSTASENSFSDRGGRATRMLQLIHFSFDGVDDASSSPTIVVRFPEDQRRERVRFALKGLDLF